MGINLFSHTREEHRKVFENRVLRQMFGPERKVLSLGPGDRN
jgi:hypothetical protein